MGQTIRGGAARDQAVKKWRGQVETFRQLGMRREAKIIETVLNELKQAEAIDAEELLSSREAAERLGVSTRTVQRHLKGGRLSTQNGPDGRKRVRAGDLRRGNIRLVAPDGEADTAQPGQEEGQTQAIGRAALRRVR